MGEREQDSQAPVEHIRSAPIEIAARPQWPYYILVGVIPVTTAMVFGAALFAGVQTALVLLLTVAAASVFSCVGILASAWARAWIDAEGVTLRPHLDLHLPGHRPKRFRFAWSEVTRVHSPHKLVTGAERAVVFELNRPGARSFWTLSAHPVNKVAVPAALVHDPRFLEAIRAHIPADRLAPGALRSATRDFPYPRLIGGAYAVLALLAGWVAWRLSEGEFTTSVGWVTLATLALTFIVQIIFAGIEQPEIGVTHGLMHLIVTGMPVLLVLAIITSSRAAAPALAAGIAVTFVTVSTLVLVRHRLSALLRTALLCTAFAAGATAGWFGYCGVAGKAVCSGDLCGKAWTPDGSAFLLHVNPSGDYLRKISGVCQWFTRDGRPGEVFSLPGARWTFAVGQSGAIVSAAAGERTEGVNSLWFLPRQGKPHLLVTGEAVSASASYPNSRMAILTVSSESRTEWHLLDFASLQVRPCGVTRNPAARQRIGLSDDGRVYWLEGAPPKIAPATVPSRSTPVPPDGKYFAPGETYTIYTTDADVEGPRKVIYKALTPWIEWRRGYHPQSVQVCRLAESGPARIEYVQIDFRSGTPTVSPMTEPEYRDRSSRWESFDGDAYAYLSGDVYRPARLIHRQTGRSLPLEHIGGLALSSRPVWSPDGHFLLAGGARFRLQWSSFKWVRGGEDFAEHFVPTVYLIDCDKAFGVE